RPPAPPLVPYTTLFRSRPRSRSRQRTRPLSRRTRPLPMKPGRRHHPMPRVTALRPARPGHVLVELDGERWRTIPLDVAARSGLEAGLELDRPRLRTLRRELRRGDALAAGVRALARRDRSEQELRGVLERRGVAEREREETVVALRRHGAIDDDRFACGRAAALAERGLGDAAIAFRLERDGIDRELSAAALSTLEQIGRASCRD